MIGTDTALVTEVQRHFIPRELRTQRGIVGQKRVQGFRSGAASERDAEGTFFGDGQRGGLHEFLRGAPGDGVEIGQDAGVAWPLSPTCQMHLLTAFGTLACSNALLVGGNRFALFVVAAAVAIDILFANGAPSAAVA